MSQGIPKVSPAIVRTSFGPFTLDAAARRLVEHDRPVHLSPKAFDVLCLLVAARPAVVPKADLHDRIWPGTFVVEANLSVLIAEIRRALGDSPREERFIRTVHRVGYAFAADATAAGAAASGDAASAAVVSAVDTTGAHTRGADTSGVSTAPGGPSIPAVAGTSAQGSMPHARPEPGTRCWLVWNDRHFVLGVGEHAVGRDPLCTIWLDASGVSRRHASIRVDHSHQATVTDLASTNGTFVDGVAIGAETPLADGAVLHLGAAELTFRTWSGKPPVTERIRRPAR